LELAAYGVASVVGFRNGYRGLVGDGDAIELTPASVEGINEDGGTVLGTSRGGQDPTEMADCLRRRGIEVLFVLGGDGTLRGALAIAKVAEARGQRLAVVGVPKTIDNDIPFLDQSFGFHTAFSKAAETIRAARVEARSSPPGVGLVKLMGRHSGFITCYAALARNDADFVLIPEVPFSLEGPDGLLALVRHRVEQRGHAVVVVAEGVGQDLLDVGGAADASGNKKLGDIGTLLRQGIANEFEAHGSGVNMRYFDPSYSIRSVPADPYDSVYCTRLSVAAVHAAMAGRTGVVVGRWRRRFVHLPIELAVSERNQVDRYGDLWMAVLESTRQPASLA
jgi:6-phosphofructokinase 1